MHQTADPLPTHGCSFSILVLFFWVLPLLEDDPTDADSIAYLMAWLCFAVSSLGVEQRFSDGQ